MSAPGETRRHAGSLGGQAAGRDSADDLRCEREAGVSPGVRLKTDVNADAKPDGRTGAKPKLSTFDAGDSGNGEWRGDNGTPCRVRIGTSGPTVWVPRLGAGPPSNCSPVRGSVRPGRGVRCECPLWSCQRTFRLGRIRAALIGTTMRGMACSGTCPGDAQWPDAVAALRWRRADAAGRRRLNPPGGDPSSRSSCH